MNAKAAHSILHLHENGKAEDCLKFTRGRKQP